MRFVYHYHFSAREATRDFLSEPFRLTSSDSDRAGYDHRPHLGGATFKSMAKTEEFIAATITSVVQLTRSWA